MVAKHIFKNIKGLYKSGFYSFTEIIDCENELIMIREALREKLIISQEKRLLKI